MNIVMAHRNERKSDVPTREIRTIYQRPTPQTQTPLKPDPFHRLSHPARLTCLSFNPNNNTSSITVNLGILSLSPPIDPFS
jgi:hypothetical protein